PAAAARDAAKPAPEPPARPAPEPPARRAAEPPARPAAERVAARPSTERAAAPPARPAAEPPAERVAARPAEPPAEPPAGRVAAPPARPAAEPPAERVAARPAAPPAEAPARTRGRGCDTVDVDDVMTRAAIQYDSGSPASALSLTRVALGCRQTERMYWLAVMYACAAHDAASAKLYFPKVPTNLQSGIESRCQRENLDVRTR
ncbi:MAG TPA: hypothetical protein VGD37_20670, partial [Kofleriaceae bacterium]